MKSHLNWSDYQKLELIEQKPALVKGFNAKFNQLWQRVLAYLSTSSEPYVWQTEKNGQPVWNAYDPITHQTVERITADEMRSWLEERHYQVC
jgi:hypothetical protein